MKKIINKEEWLWILRLGRLNCLEKNNNKKDLTETKPEEFSCCKDIIKFENSIHRPVFNIDFEF